MAGSSLSSAAIVLLLDLIRVYNTGQELDPTIDTAEPLIVLRRLGQVDDSQGQSVEGREQARDGVNVKVEKSNKVHVGFPYQKLEIARRRLTSSR